jgi:hypothetical protein
MKGDIQGLLQSSPPLLLAGFPAERCPDPWCRRLALALALASGTILEAFDSG